MMKRLIREVDDEPKESYTIQEHQEGVENMQKNRHTT